jgi:hypothetical protein
MSEVQERYWLVKQGVRAPMSDEWRVEDFVCCEVPVGGDAALALEVFTSREGAEAELRGMERLAPDKCHLYAMEEYEQQFADRAPGNSEGVVELVGPELFEMLDSSGVPYVLVDPPPVDEPIPEGLRIKLAPVFAEELRRWLLEAVRKGWA